MKHQRENNEDLSGVAIIGMACRFPGSSNLDEFWQHLVRGEECITFYSEAELAETGVDPASLSNPDYVKARGEVADVDQFDALFFGIPPGEAELMDPQHRMLLECAWEALEHAGVDSTEVNGSIGVFAGKSMDYYLLLNLYSTIKKELSTGLLQTVRGNEKDSLTATIAYHLDLKGPSITIQSSSSTSLVAVCYACQSLLCYQSDILLAGGITAGPPRKSGYLYQPGGIWSEDGHCRAFDAEARGFVPGSGMGMVVLKRLEDALDDGDHIWAVIKGFAVNNDGSAKVSYSAPSVEAQFQVVAAAQAAADVHPESIQYIEAHGTGTLLGDPIEITALTQAFQLRTTKKQFCALGSVKSNIGHLDNAAGVAGLIKTALALKHQKIPPSLHFRKPNPAMDFENSPFYVNTRLREWKTNGSPRRAGVTSLGMGGTNAHVVLEEPPHPESPGMSRSWQLVLFSAKTPTALEKKTAQMAEEFKGKKEINLADAAFTLALGRREFPYRRILLCRRLEDAASHLEQATQGRVFDSAGPSPNRPVIFMFSGQGAQYVNMASQLYRDEPRFREVVDYCAEFLLPLLGEDIRTILYPPGEDTRQYTERLNQTRITQPVLFTVEYALARLWMHWGVVPDGMIGHSIGEYTAACVSGCLSLEDMLTLVTARGRLMQESKAGAMISVGLGEAELLGILPADLSLAAVNSPKLCVVSGSPEAVERFEKRLEEKNLFCKRLRTSHAFHSSHMDTLLAEFVRLAGTFTFHPPHLRFISGVTGTWIRESQVRDPQYWGDQLRKTVRFSLGLREILKHSRPNFLEIGPGNTLGLFVSHHLEKRSTAEILSSLRHFKQTEPDSAFLLTTLGKLWLSGVKVEWKNYYGDEVRRKIPLPLYPFERKRFWFEDDFHVPPRVENDRPVSIAGAAPVNESREVKEPVASTFEPRPSLANPYEAPADDTERSIAAIWEELLGIRPVGRQDNFFDLKGHSLLASLVLSRVQETFAIRLPLQSIFETPTVAGISRCIKSERQQTLRSGEIEILPPREHYELSYSQHRLWVLHGRDPGTSLYNIVVHLLLEEAVSETVVHRTLQYLVQRHESLRTSFKEVDKKPVQVIESLTLPGNFLKVADWTHLRQQEREARLRQLILEEGAFAFDLGCAPLFRVTLVRFQPQHLEFIINLHHIITDGWSVEILKQEFLQVYKTYSQGGTAALEPLTLQYKDYAAWQNRKLADEAASGQAVEFWKSQLSGTLPMLNLPYDFPRSRLKNHESAGYRLLLPEALSTRLQALARDFHGSLFMVLLAGFNLLLGQLTGQSDIILAIPAAARQQDAIKNIIGMFVNTLILRITVDSSLRFPRFFQLLKEKTFKMLEYQGFPMELICGRLKIKYPDLSVFFNMETVGSTHLDLLTTFNSRHIESVQDAKFHLVCYLRKYRNGIEIEAHYLKQLFLPGTIEKIMEMYRQILENIGSDPDRVIGSYTLSGKRKKLLRHEEEENSLSRLNDLGVGIGRVG